MSRSDLDKNISGVYPGKNDQITLFKDIVKESLNITDDGVKRQVDGSKELEINPGILKLLDGGTSWTIKVVGNGLQFIPNGETEPAVTFSTEGTFELVTPLTFKDGEIKSQIGGGSVTKEGDSRGIPHTGLRGFQSGRLDAKSDWQKICELPNTFGKYHLEAWSIDTSEGKYAHCTADIVFAPPGATLYTNTESWLQKLRFKVRSFFSNGGKNVVIRKQIYVKWGPESGTSNNGITIQVNDSREIQIKVNKQTEVTDGIYYTLDRIWEGENWIP